MITHSLTLRIQTAVAILYSLGIIASSTPAFGNISNVVVVLYYLFVPGYVVTLYLGEDYALFQRFAFSIVLGFTFVLTIAAIRNATSDAFPLPFNVIIPVGTIIFVALDYFRSKSQVAIDIK